MIIALCTNKSRRNHPFFCFFFPLDNNIKYRYLAFIMLRRLFFIFIILIQSFSAGAEENTERYTVKLLVLGPGAPIYTWWGHTGIIIEDSLTQRSTFYDFGNFSFEEGFYRNFLMGRLIYQAGAVPSSLYIPYVLQENRELDIYTLDISQQKAMEMHEALREKVRPENRHYLYDHFEDNCSTRIRDYLDIALDGKLRALTEIKPAGSNRRQFRRFSYFNFPIDFMLNYLQGSGIDGDISQWDALYLPSELGLALEELDQQEKIILHHEKLSTAADRFDRIIPLENPTWPKPLLWGLGFALFFALIFKLRRNTAWTILLLITGLLGTMLFLMSNFTDHHVTYHNLNLLYCSPMSLLLLFLYKSNKRIQRRIFLAIWWLFCTLAIFTLLQNWFSAEGHNNLDTVLFFLPSYLLFGWLEWKKLQTLSISKRKQNYLSLYRRRTNAFPVKYRKYPGKFKQQSRRRKR